jgi:predicted dehydrogenase
MIKVGIAGIGFMGMTHYRAYEALRGIKVTAICSRDRKKLAGDWRSIKGNFGDPGTQMDLTGINAYSDFDALLADPEIDLIDLCLPPHLHVDATVAALRAGKHVFCEKPMALSAAGCKKMVAAAVKAERQLMVGHVLPFFPEYAFALKTIRSGKYGRVLGGHFKRVISDPLWIKDFYDPAQVGGPMIDLHVHDAHFIRLAFGMPQSVVSQGRMRGEVVEYFNSQFQFADPNLVVSATSGVIGQQGRSFTQAYEIHLEKATLVYDFAEFDGKPTLNVPCTVLNSKGKAIAAKLPEGDAFQGEIKEVVRALRTGTPSSLLGGDLARDAITICHKQTQAVKTGRSVKIS